MNCTLKGTAKRGTGSKMENCECRDKDGFCTSNGKWCHLMTDCKKRKYKSIEKLGVLERIQINFNLPERISRFDRDYKDYNFNHYSLR